jgi:hypothetical protein
MILVNYFENSRFFIIRLYTSQSKVLNQVSVKTICKKITKRENILISGTNGIKTYRNISG